MLAWYAYMAYAQLVFDRISSSGDVYNKLLHGLQMICCCLDGVAGDPSYTLL
jgi:hypothetical protein